MGIRLKGFDYKSPYFYMVTIKRLKGFEPFCAISRASEGEIRAAITPGGNSAAAAAESGTLNRAALPADCCAALPTNYNFYLIPNAITRAFIAAIREFSEKWYCIEPIEIFAIMPDHIHLIIKIAAIEKRKSLPVIVWQLMKTLTAAYWETIAPGRFPVQPSPTAVGESAEAAAESKPLKRYPDIFDPSWHDWIVKRRGQLATFSRYIRENAYRAWLRAAHADYFGRVSRVSFLAREWFAYGNLALLESPVLRGFKGHRSTAEGSPEWLAMLDEAARIGPGGAGISTFMSPLEKAVGNVIAKTGGGLIVLSPEGFGPRWHPVREKERFCAAGRMLFLSLYGAETRQPTNAELYKRCHEMVDLVASMRSEK